ncbi:class I SAM-dependent methyltransferase [Thalassobacillus sp. CUG 92003]|uniref:class I SAM-dependent methyltransferase n=1 Tax=Thalassobacillus sp. CUG 92003 TaxID=2736641 RepID=UPI0015E76AB6|nr:class I SAM-dependent methyltransferase [Thalassobacillus sp. CUG 92003]
MEKNNHHHHAHNHRKKVEYLDSAERRAQFSPESLLSLFPIERTDTILDVGAGTGFLTIPAAKKTDGMVYALDIDPNILEMTKSKAQNEQLENVQTIERELKDLSVDNNSIDIVLASLVLHEINALSETIQMIHEVLKVNGYFACIELEAMEDEDPNHPRISAAHMEQVLNDAGFNVTKKLYPTESVYVLIAQKHV